MTDQDADAVTARGGCLCGAVRYELRGKLRGVVLCHCGQCRRSHGHIGAYTSVSMENLMLVEERGLKWYVSSEKARRGFCGICGGRLFWEPHAQGRIAVAAGSLDQPSGLETIGQIYMAEAADYYEVADGVEQYWSGLGN